MLTARLGVANGKADVPKVCALGVVSELVCVCVCVCEYVSVCLSMEVIDGGESFSEPYARAACKSGAVLAAFVTLFFVSRQPVLVSSPSNDGPEWTS